VGVGVGDCGGCVGDGVGRGVGELEGVGVLCGRLPRLPQPSSSLSLCLSIEVNPSEGSSSVRDGDRIRLRGDLAKLIPPTVTTVTMPTAPTAISLSSCLRFCGACHGWERVSDFARRVGGRCVDDADAVGAFRDLPDVAAHRTNGSTPPISSGGVPAPGSVTGALPSSFWTIHDEGCMPASSRASPGVFSPGWSSCDM
jgi:hypothetical protein